MNYRLIIDEINESSTEMLPKAHLRDCDMEIYSRFTHENRRREWLKSKVLIWKHFGKHVDYDSNGAPMIEGSYVSISHSRGYVAVAYSETNRCGVDVEWSERDAARMVKKYASEQEVELARQIFPRNPELLVWCAKEALYKCAGIEGAEFQTDLKVEGIRDMKEGDMIVDIELHTPLSEAMDRAPIILVCSAFGEQIDIKAEFINTLVLCHCIK